MKISLLNDAVLISPIDAEGFCERASGLVVAKRLWEPRLAFVLGVGSGHVRFKAPGGRVPLWVNLGDVVVYGNQAGQEIILDGSHEIGGVAVGWWPARFVGPVKCRIVREADLVAVWDGPIPAVHKAAFSRRSALLGAVHA